MAASRNLVALQNNDTTFYLALLAPLGGPLNLTGVTLKLWVKASESALDSSATTYLAGSGLTVTAALGGMVTWVLPHTAATTAGSQWWRIDATLAGGAIITCIYGALNIVAV